MAQGWFAAGERYEIPMVFEVALWQATSEEEAPKASSSSSGWHFLDQE
jgi:hypothetical protein